MNDICDIIDFILNNFNNCYHQGGGASIIRIKDTDLMPFDYIEFAQRELDKNKPENLINCIGHLKRSIDCQIDRYLRTINVYNLISKSNLKFSTKLEVIELTGMFHSKSLHLLNTIRNKMEHEYSIPNINDLQVYYELCNAFILVVESYMSILSMYGDPFEWCPDEIPKKKSYVSLIIKFEQKTPSLTFELYEKKKERTIVFKPKNKESMISYLAALNIFFILCRNDTILSDKYAIKLLNDLKSNLTLHPA